MRIHCFLFPSDSWSARDILGTEAPFSAQLQLIAVDIDTCHEEEEEDEDEDEEEDEEADQNEDNTEEDETDDNSEHEDESVEYQSDDDYHYQVLTGGIYMASTIDASCRAWNCKIVKDKVSGREVIGRHGNIEFLRHSLPPEHGTLLPDLLSV